jgi:hypothetical protein
MKTIRMLQSVSATVVSATLIVAFFISPLSTEAANTYSIHIDRNAGQFLAAPDSVSLSATSTATFETWVKFDSLPPATGDNTFEFLTHWDSSVSQKGFFWATHNNSGVYLLDWANSDNGTDESLVSVNWNPSTGVWYHVAVTFASGTVKFYVNGVQQGTDQTSTKTSIFDNTVNFDVGSIQGPNGIIIGTMDDGRVYNIARSASAIASDYTQELVGNESGLVAYWKFNNDLTDSTGNGNTLTNNNGAPFSTDVPFPVVPPFTTVLKVRKSANEARTSSTALQSDNALVLQLAGNKTYIIDGVVFVSAGTTQPDIKISFGGAGVTTATLGYLNDTIQGVLGNNAATGKIDLNATPQVIHVQGTVVTSANGTFQLSWAQNTANANPTNVLLGSYLRAEEI